MIKDSNTDQTAINVESNLYNYAKHSNYSHTLMMKENYC